MREIRKCVLMTSRPMEQSGADSGKWLAASLPASLPVSLAASERATELTGCSLANSLHCHYTLPAAARTLRRAAELPLEPLGPLEPLRPLEPVAAAAEAEVTLMQENEPSRGGRRAKRRKGGAHLALAAKLPVAGISGRSHSASRRPQRQSLACWQFGRQFRCQLGATFPAKRRSFVCVEPDFGLPNTVCGRLLSWLH